MSLDPAQLGSGGGNLHQSKGSTIKNRSYWDGKEVLVLVWVFLDLFLDFYFPKRGRGMSFCVVGFLCMQLERKEEC